MKRNWVIVVIILLTIGVYGCGNTNEVKGNAENTVKVKEAKVEERKMEMVTLGMNPTLTSNSSLYIALEKGYFKEENLDVSVKPFESANAVNVAIASESVDVGGTGITADMYNMMAAGQKIIIVADKGREHEGFHFSAVMVNPDSPIASVQDLKGKRAGVSTIGSTLHYNMARVLENHSLTTKDVQWVPMNTTRGVIEALRGRNVDAAVLNEPNVTQAVTEGFGKVIAYVSDEIEFQSSGIFFSPKFAANKDVGVRFLKAYLKGARYYSDAVLKQVDGKLVKGENYDDVVSIVSKFTAQTKDVIQQSFSYIDPNGKLNVSNIQEQIDWYAKEKLITKAIDAKEIVNTEILDQALKELNK